MVNPIAVIDIGTNSVLLTIAERLGNQIESIHEAATITRLGERLTKSKVFKPEAMERTLAALKDYASICKKHSVEKIVTVGTAAMRKSSNSGEFAKMIKKECGLNVEIISGEREAELSFKAVEKDFGSDIILIDIGGGSTELIVPNHKSSGGPPWPPSVTSLPLGCVTLHEKFVESDPISDGDFKKLRGAIDEALPLTPALSPEGRGELVATAGTATTLAAMKLRLTEYNHSEVHGFKLTKSNIEEIIDTLKALSIEERKKLAGLEPARADVILPGAMILKTAMEKLGFNEVTVSDRGVRWGLIYEFT